MIVLHSTHFYPPVILAPFPDSAGKGKECKRLLRAKKAKESNFAMKHPEKTKPCQILDFR